MEMPSRQMSEKVKLWGIFPGAKVKRGPDWKWENQDGTYQNVYSRLPDDTEILKHFDSDLF